MVKIVLLIVTLCFILIFPVYENSKIKITEKELKNTNIPIAEIKKAKFYTYENNLSKEGNFTKLDMYKSFYKAKDLKVHDITKKENYFSKKVILKDNILTLYDFKYYNNEYSLDSNYVIYNLDTKNIKGDKFLISSEEYNGSGKKFFVDPNRDINASFISFYLKVKK